LSLTNWPPGYPADHFGPFRWAEFEDDRHLILLQIATGLVLLTAVLAQGRGL
jgi:hypothetical protein